MKKIISIVGARPQFIKYAPLSAALASKFHDICINTGQHYDDEMSTIFFEDLKINRPKYNLAIGSGSHGEQTAKMLSGIEPILLEEAPDAVVVFGDTNTTLAGALAAAKLQIPLVHIEAGLRSFNRTMPEEINRITTDHMSSVLIAPSKEAVENLKREGIEQNVYRTGDIMIDTLKMAKEYLSKQATSNGESAYILATIHRNYNTDSPERLLSIMEHLNKTPLPVKFPIHPRTKNLLANRKVDLRDYQNISFINPLGYFDFIQAMLQCRFLITDSGGAQKEAYHLKKPCLTLRFETEWVETLTGDWNQLVGDNLPRLNDMLKEPSKSDYIDNLYGNGEAAKEIIEVLEQYLG